jgi:hypothetical protein
MKAAIVSLVVVLASGLTAKPDSMHEVFDDFAHFATRIPFAKYPDELFRRITDCMETAGPTLYPKASDAAWTGWTQYGIQGGQPDDPWSVNNTAGWMEYDPRNLTYQGHGIIVIEPCNTVSNLAYYRIIPEICTKRGKLTMDDGYINAIIQGFATLGMGSSFMHGSRTQLGGAFDNIPISVIAYQYFQLMTSSLKPLIFPGVNDTDSVLHELSTTPRAYNGRVLATKLHNIPIEFGLDDWQSALNALDRPQYFFTFGAIIINALTTFAPDSISDGIIKLSCSLFQLTPEVTAFLEHTFVPVIRGSMVNIQLTLAEKASVLSKGVGTIIKLLYAFMWQEGIFKYGILYNPTWNVFGALLIPAVNALSNKLTGFEHPDASIQMGEDIYPGQEWCRVKHTSPHAKWHQQSANGLMDLGYFADAVRTVIDNAQARQASRTDSVRTGSVGSDVVFTTAVFDEWAADMQAQSWSEGYVVTQAFVHAVKDIVVDMDRCSTGVADDSITWEDLACYLESITSAADFVQKLFREISAYHDLLATQVQRTPNARLVLV